MEEEQSVGWGMFSLPYKTGKLVEACLPLFMEMDMPLWEKCKKEYDNARREGEKKRIHVEGQWTKLDNLVATKHPGRVVNGG